MLAELVSGVIDPARMRRLADRVLAIDMALEGADFLDLYRYFLERTGNEIESSKRTARGAGRTGRGRRALHQGRGLSERLDTGLQLHARRRHSRRCGRHIRLLFAGKFDLDDMPAILALDDSGLLEPPRFYALGGGLAWPGELSGLCALLRRCDLASIDRHYDDLLGETS